MRFYLNLFFTFAKIGAMTFGGGYAMLPMFQRELVENRGWTTEEELMDYFAMGQCLPGAIAINTSTFIGQKLKGIPGGMAATLGMVFPSILIITLLAGIIGAFSHLELVQHAFGGIRICVCVLILNAVVKLAGKALVDKLTVGIFLVVALGSFFLDVSPVIFIIAASASGILIQSIRAGAHDKSETQGGGKK
jgi:chromate transporter